MPRLSVDIDLVYIPIKNREESLSEISEGLVDIGRSLERFIPNVKIQFSKMGKTEYTIKLLVQVDQSIIKVEISPVLRGTVYGAKTMRIGRVAEETFGFAEVPLASFEDLFAGKIVAALDRQHPRDLFDIKLLLEIGLSFHTGVLLHSNYIVPLLPIISMFYFRHYDDSTSEYITITLLALYFFITCIFAATVGSFSHCIHT